METAKSKETGRLFRFINFLTDIVFVGVILFFTGNYLGGLTDENFKLYYLLYLFLYYLIFESLTGRTLGKLLTKTKVVSVNNGKASFGKVFLRTLIRFIPFETLTGFAYPWHDTWTDTKVIDV